MDLDANSLFAQVGYDRSSQTITLIKGHSWAFDGKTAWRSANETDKHDRTNTTLAELDIRIYALPQNETSSNLSMRQISTQNEVVLNTYKPSSGMFIMRVLNTIYHSEELQTWIQVPTKRLLFEVVYISDPQLHSKYLPIVKKCSTPLR